MRAACAAVIVMLGAIGLLAQGAPVARATVRIRLVDQLGEDLGEAKVSHFVSQDDGRDLKGRFQKGTASGIPFGVYRLETFQTGFSSAQRDVLVYQSEVWAVLGLQIGTIDFPLDRYRMVGSIQNFVSDNEPIFVRLIGVHQEVAADTKPSETGTFMIDGIPRGLYMLLTVRGNEVLSSRLIEIPTTAPVSVELGTYRGNVTQ